MILASYSNNLLILVLSRSVCLLASDCHRKSMIIVHIRDKFFLGLKLIVNPI